MADELKVLGQISPSATTYTTLYTVPNLAQTTVSSILICDQGSGATAYRISVHIAGADTGSPTTKQFLFFDKALASKATDVHVLGMTLNQSDVIQVYADDADISFTMFGVETK